jgi:DNA modification methylase
MPRAPRTSPCTRDALRTERDVVETLAGRAVTIDELYAAVEAAGVHERDGGTDAIATHGTDTVWRRRVRNSLQSLKRAGRAQRVGDGLWVIDGTRDAPRRMLLIIPGELGPVELHLADAAEYLDRLAADGTEIELVLTDPPYALERGVVADPERSRGERVYARDHTKVLRAGYVEVDAGAYTEFTYRWVAAAAALLHGRTGAHLAVITGPQQAARVQCAAEDAGLSFVNQVVARRVMPVFNASPRKFAHGHYVVTIMCSGPATGRQRFFAVPDDLPTAASGRAFPRSWWDNVGRSDRPGLLRYDNALPEPLVSRVVRALTRGPENGHDPWTATVVDPMVGGGTAAVVCWQTRRRLLAADLNPTALRFTAARLTAEHLAAQAGVA